MDRFLGFLFILLVHTVWITRGSKALPNNFPFEIEVSKFKLPETFYPENGGDVIPIFLPVRKPSYPEIDFQNYKLPDDFYPENDRDAIPVNPLPKTYSSKVDAKRRSPPLDTSSVFPTKRFLARDLDKEDSMAPNESRQHFSKNPLLKLNDVSQNTIFSDKVSGSLDKEVNRCRALLSQQIIEGAKCLKIAKSKRLQASGYWNP